MAWLPERCKNFVDVFIRFDRIYERDRHTNGQTNTQTPHDDIGLACIASRGKKTVEAGDMDSTMEQCTGYVCVLVQ